MQPIQEAASMVKAYNKNILFHVDAVHGIWKVSHLPEAPEGGYVFHQWT